jgi:hypothetical protein
MAETEEELDAEHAADLELFKATLPAVIRCTQPECGTVGGAIIEPTLERVDLWEWEQRKYDPVRPSFTCDACAALIKARVQAAIASVPKQTVRLPDGSEMATYDLGEVGKRLFPIGD